MWDRLKKKLSNLFEEIDDKEDEAPVEWNDSKQELRTKMTYQYPARKPFRFPVIPDASSKESNDSESEKPAFSRKQSGSKEKANPEQQPEQETQQDRKVYKPDYGEPFTPSDVPSPIYGFQKRDKSEEEYNEIPAFQRKQERERSSSMLEEEVPSEPAVEQPQTEPSEAVIENTAVSSDDLPFKTNQEEEEQAKPETEKREPDNQTRQPKPQRQKTADRKTTSRTVKNHCHSTL